MIADVFSVDALEVAKQFNLKTYAYCASSGCVALQGKDLIDSVQQRTIESYKTILHISKGLDLADGIILNSFMDLERKIITALQENKNKYPPIYPLGPILQSELASINETASKCLKWLDNQPPNSVLYVSFGSGGTLSHDQLNELALGLEMSGHKFLWAMRASNGFAYSAYLNEQKEDPFDYLPKGFLERIKDQGFVLPSWAPEIEVLRHGSTRAFLTHCGWNSTLECVFYGKPIIVWPLSAEQRMNAVMLSEELKIAVRPKENANNDGIIVEKEEVSRIVKSVMEGDKGKEINRRIQVFKDAAAKALGKDEQRMNAVLITEELKIALWLKKDHDNNKGIVRKEEVCRIVKRVMEGDEGKEINRKIQVYKDVATKALSDDGSSTKTLSCLLSDLLNGK
ncbi:UDP-glycosyltransferase 72B1-like [Neltuma alba]|uniref:UDP-glycosyltransferase 72B1-like n=1 Tax=Neltuma alba TaxID=207710 RepID=UPI0010A576C8|nr:UDP-glycosyltransferase 72B1-like [Prosopis alba]